MLWLVSFYSYLCPTCELFGIYTSFIKGLGQRMRIITIEQEIYFNLSWCFNLAGIMLLISRSMDLWRIIYITPLFINCCFHLFRSSTSFFSSQYLLLFLKTSRSSFFLPSPFIFVICPSVVEYEQSNLLFIIRYYLQMSSSLLYIQELFHYLVSYLVK